MDAREACKQMELAAYELAEAERHERAARALRLEAVRRTASVHVFFKEALTKIDHAKPEQSDADGSRHP